MKFVVSGVPSGPWKATLKLRNAKASQVGYQLRAVTNSSWTQSSLTYASAPAIGGTLGNSGPTTSGSWTSLDVSSAFAGNGTYSFALTGGNGSTIQVGSRESATPPQLVIEPMTSASSTIIPAGFGESLGAYDPGASLASSTSLRSDHYFVSWDKNTQWVAGLDQHQALVQGLANTQARGRQPIVTLEPWTGAGMSSSSLLQDVVAGKYDANIQWACNDLKSYPGTVIVRWGHEMEHVTGRYPWATNDSGAFIQAYRYFVDRCRALAPNTSYMWSPTGNRNLAPYWPGSSYADYVGLSVYDYPDWEVSYYGYNRSFHENFSERYGYVAGFGKPIIIPEFAATGATQVQWLRDALADMANFPLLQAAVFFNAKDPVGWGNLPAPDWRVDPALLSSPGA